MQPVERWHPVFTFLFHIRRNLVPLVYIRQNQKQMKAPYFLLIIALLVIGCSPKSASRMQGPHSLPGAMHLPDMPSSIPFSNFRSSAINILISPPLDLTVDTVYNNTISAYEVYNGRVHRRWFFWKAAWKEKTIYKISFRQSDSSTIYTLKSESFEAPDENWIDKRWQRVEPSVKTKENLIIQKLNN